MLAGSPVDALLGATAPYPLAQVALDSAVAAPSAAAGTAAFRTLLAEQLQTKPPGHPPRLQPTAGDPARQLDPAQLAEIEDAARQFEALLLYTLLKQMWASVPESKLFGNSLGSQFYREMWLEALASEVAVNGPGLGVAEPLKREMISLAASTVPPEPDSDQ